MATDNTKKTILVVHRLATPDSKESWGGKSSEELESAKKEFRKNKEFKFIYAEGREDAEKLLPKCDAIIVDSEIGIDGEYNSLLGMLDASVLMLEAYFQKKSAVGVESDSGGVVLVSLDSKSQEIVKTLEEKTRSIAQKELKDVVSEAKGKHIDSLGKDSEKVLEELSFFRGGIPSDHFDPDELDNPFLGAFAKLQEEFKLNERPIENEKPIERPNEGFKIKMR